MAEFYPKANIPPSDATMLAGVMDWSEADFQARVEARVKQLGIPEATLLRSVGLSGDEIRKVPKRGRRIDTVVGIAKALRWTMGQALGTTDPTLFLERDRDIDPAKLMMALRIAEDIVGDNPEGRSPAVVADVASLVYSLIRERAEAGLPVECDVVRSIVSATLRRVFPR